MRARAGIESLETHIRALEDEVEQEQRARRGMQTLVESLECEKAVLEAKVGDLRS
jgi:hypothetical protein